MGVSNTRSRWPNLFEGALRGTGVRRIAVLSSSELRGALLQRRRPLEMSTGPGRPHGETPVSLEAAHMLLSFERPAHTAGGSLDSDPGPLWVALPLRGP